MTTPTTGRDLGQIAYETWQTARGVPNELGDHGWSMGGSDFRVRWTATANAIADQVRKDERDRLRAYLAKALSQRVVTIYAIPGTHIMTTGTLAQADSLAQSVMAEIAIDMDQLDPAGIAREITQLTEGWDDPPTVSPDLARDIYMAGRKPGVLLDTADLARAAQLMAEDAKQRYHDRGRPVIDDD